MWLRLCPCPRARASSLIAAMPAETGRQLFDMRGGLMWEQRVEKEVRALLGEDNLEGGRRHGRRRRRRSSRDGGGGSRLSHSSSTPAMMYETSKLDDGVRAIQRFGMHGSNLITMRDHSASSRQDGVVPKIRMVPTVVDAHWIPGGKLLTHKAEFYFESVDLQPKKAQATPWALPAAGQLKTPKAFAEPLVSAAASVAAASPSGALAGKDARALRFERDTDRSTGSAHPSLVAAAHAALPGRMCTPAARG